MPSVYVETSVPSYYFEKRETPEAITWRRATRRWWDAYRGSFLVYTSDVVLEELSRAPEAKSRACLRLLDGVELLERDERVAAAAAYYIEHQLLPRTAVADSLHVALASRHKMDYLLTWNIKHIANPNKARHLSILNGRLGLSVPSLITPLTLLPESNP